MKSKQNRFALLCAILAVILAMAFVLTGCGSKSSGGGGNTQIEQPEDNDELSSGEEEPEEDGEEDTGDTSLPVFNTKYPTTARHGYYTEYLGTVARKTPEVKDGGLGTYPKYGTVLSMTTEQKNALNVEAGSLCGRSTLNATGTFDKMDADGNLFLSDGTAVTDGSGNPRKLYKHTAAAGMYLGNVSDSEPAVVKRITFKPRAHSNSYNVTGLYAPAGEVVKVEMKKADFDAAGKSVTFHIGQCLYNGKNNNLWSAKSYNRMPVIMSTLVFNVNNSTYDESTDTYTCYIGSYLGGPIYVRNISKQATMTISGAVNYRHFILGHTTEEEYEKLSESTAPYFDLEVWDNGVLQSGPLNYAKSYSYEDMYKTAILWEKISLVSTNVRGTGVVFLYDPFVAAGAAVAFPGQFSVNNPMGWMTNALNYKGFENSGAWGVVHEYNHNFQGWGLDGGGEVTNNALNIAEYTQFTKISSYRTLSSSGEGGLSGWNTYTSASWALGRVLNRQYSGTDQLSIYAALIHNIGARDFVLAAKRSGRDNYYTDMCNTTGYDMTYFFSELIEQKPSDAAINAIKEKNYPAFVPVSCVYQTGRSVTSAAGVKHYIKTMQPFVIKYGEDFDIDLGKYTTDGDGHYVSGSVVIPDGFSYTVKSVTAPESGSVSKTGDYSYRYTPGEAMRSGDIRVTLRITKDDKAFDVRDVELVLAFEQTHEKDKNVLERTVYTYDEGTLPASAKAAYDGGYAGHKTKTEINNVNPVQNSNTDIWVPDPAKNAVMEVRGKLYIATDGDYRVALRGRHSAALYLSRNGKNYSYAAKLDHNTNTNTFWDDPDTYYDCKDLTAGGWLYFKEVLLVDYASAFVGLGFGRIETEGGTIDENGVVSGESQANVTLAYPTAYRNTYKFPDGEFESEYLFTRKLTYTYDGSVSYPDKGTLVELNGYEPWPNAGYDANAGELFDDNDSNFIHSNKGAAYDITPEHPFEMTVDLGAARRVNTMTIYGEPTRQYQPKDFVLYGGINKNNLKKLAEVTDAQKTGNNVVVTFDECSVRYYRLVCTATMVSGNPTGSKYIAFRCIKFDKTLRLPGGIFKAPSDPSVTYRGEWKVQNALSDFGRIYVGGDGATADFGFSGTRFAVGAYKASVYGKIEVHIDGELKATVDISAAENATSFVYVSDKLADGKHHVKLVCKGKANIASVTEWE